MTLIVEDGSVVASAESYVTVAQFKTYCDNRGISYAATTDTQIEQNARKGFDYMLQRYWGMWKGYRKDASQMGDWPRSFVYLEPVVKGLPGSYPYLVPEDSIPFEVRNAQCELMVRVVSADLMPDSGQLEQSVTVGPISVTYNPNAISPDPVYGVVDGYLKPYLIGGGAAVATRKVLRA